MELLDQLARTIQETDAPIATASEVATRTDVGRRTVLERLKTLADAGLVGSRKVGSGRVFWPIDDPTLAAREQDDQDGEHLGDGPGAFREENSSAEELIDPDDDRDELVEDVDDQDESGAESAALDNVDFPSTKDRGECESAVLAARDYLRDEGPASMRELVLEVMPRVSVGYEPPESLEEGERFRGGWWRSVVRPGLSALEDVEKPSGGGRWRYVG